MGSELAVKDQEREVEEVEDSSAKMSAPRAAAMKKANFMLAIN